jgi:dTDP-glucose pyrophosphorylase
MSETRVFMKCLGESESRGVKLQYRVQRLGRDLARAALVGVGARGETGKIILLSGQNVRNIQTLFRPKTVLHTSVYQGLS